ncbi:hypothetical protein [Legionella birminghamensis]|uniref:hypothetical protein n=1 Tax=Legionella birminghamensis TaxID=28083 RepID=UPI001558CC58|nr:hypothetical protein [Legionella birminghamensis]
MNESRSGLLHVVRKDGKRMGIMPLPRHCEPWRSNPERSLNATQIWIASRCSQRREADGYYALAPRHCEPCEAIQIGA